MAYTTIQEVINLSNVKPEHLRLARGNTVRMNEIIQAWINQSESLINLYCHRSFRGETNTDIMNVIRNVCTRLVSNMILQARSRADAPFIKVNEWSIEHVKDEIFTKSLKEDLKYLVVDRSPVSDNITLFAITGK